MGRLCSIFVTKHNNLNICIDRSSVIFAEERFCRVESGLRILTVGDGRLFVIRNFV